MMNEIPMKLKLLILRAIAERAAQLEWGTDEQIDTEDAFYTLSERWFGIDWENHTYLLKATTSEAMAYGLKIIAAIIEGLGYEV